MRQLFGLLCTVVSLVTLGSSTVSATPVTYRVTIDITWSEQTHPTDWPLFPHTSPWIGGIHKPTVTFWEPGLLASNGVQLVAEEGDHITFFDEILAEAALGNASAFRIIAGGVDAPGTQVVTFTTDRTFPMVTLITMIAPSPDWFAGTTGFNLFPGNRWVDGLRVPLYPFDAGTDSGTTYDSFNLSTVPPVPVYRIFTDPLGVGGVSPPVGTYLIEVLNVNGREPYADDDNDGLNNLHEAALGSNLIFPHSDGDGIPDGMDNCPTVSNLDQLDADNDGVGDDCDVCPSDTDESQVDTDGNGTGDVCDTGDGLLWFTSISPGMQVWQPDSGFTFYNLYRGDLAVLRQTGQASQDPISPAVDRFCSLLTPSGSDDYSPEQGEGVFYLVTGSAGTTESSLGEDRWGYARPNVHSCP